MTVFISDIDQLNMLLSRNKKLDFNIRFPMLEPEENHHWQKKIKQHYFNCGCDTGKQFMLYALLVDVAGVCCMYLLGDGQLHLSWFAWSILFIFLMAGVGKSIGRETAYKKLTEDLKLLEQMLKNTTDPSTVIVPYP